MNVRTKAATIFCVIAGLAGFTIGLSAQDSAKELAALQAVDQTWLKAYNAGEVDTLASFYDEHAVLLLPGAPAANGRAAIRAFFAKDTAESKKAGFTTSIGPNPAGGVSGDMGWQSGTYVVKDKSGKIVDTVYYFSVSVKRGGKWLYVRDTYNSDSSPAPAESTAPQKK